MEIVLNKLIINNKEINLTINHNDIIGISTNDKLSFLKLISLNLPLKGEVLVDGIKVNEENISMYRRKLSIVNTYTQLPFIKTVLDYMNYIITSQNLKINKPNKKISDSLRIVGLNDKYLLREINTLSSSEKELIQLASSLLSNPEIIILTDQLLRLDLKNQKKIYMLLLRLKEQYHKTIIIISDNADILYKYCTRGIIIKNSRIISDGPIKDVYSKVELLKRNKFSVPIFTEFTHQARKNKKVKIDFHKDIRDIIKDIYKHV